MDIAEKVEALRGLLSDHMGCEVDKGFTFRRDTYWFRILVRDVQPKPTLHVPTSVFEDRDVEEIWNNLERLQVPQTLLADPERNLLYTRFGEVEKYDP